MESFESSQVDEKELQKNSKRNPGGQVNVSFFSSSKTRSVSGQTARNKRILMLLYDYFFTIRSIFYFPFQANFQAKIALGSLHFSVKFW